MHSNIESLTFILSKASQNILYFSVYDPTLNCNLAERAQYPLTLAYALTIHKSQGMSLPNVVLDCMYINKPGQLGVAIGRALSTEGLQVKNFKARHCIPQPEAMNKVYANESFPLLLDMTCCHPLMIVADCGDEHVACDDNDDHQHDHGPHNDNGGGDNGSGNNVDTEHDDGDNGQGDNEEWGDEADLFWGNIDLTNQTDNPIAINMIDLIDTVKYKQTITPFHTEVNHSLELLATVDVRKLENFCRLQIEHLTKLYEDICSNEKGQRVHNLFYTAVKEYQCSSTFRDQCKNTLFYSSQLSQSQQHIAFKLFEQLRKNIIHDKENDIPPNVSEQNARNIKDTLSDSQGKIRYLGGFTFAKIKYKLQSKLKPLVHSVNVKKRQQIEGINVKLMYIDHVTRSQAQILKQSNIQDSILETERRQNLRGSLLHVTDECYLFMKSLCKNTLQVQTLQTLIEHGENFMTFVTAELLSNEKLQNEWFGLFSGDCTCGDSVEFVKQLVDELFKDVVSLFVKPMTNQFRKDYLGDIQKKKVDAHRKQIGKTQKVTTPATATSTKPLSYDFIIEDASTNKSLTHCSLKNYVGNEKGFPSSLTKQHLQMLCTAYNIASNMRETKAKLLSKLLSEVSLHHSIPNPTAIPSSNASHTKRGTSGRKRKRQSDTCPECQLEYHEGEQWIQCDTCKRWLHRACAEIVDEDEWEELQQDNAQFKCNLC